MCHAATNIVPIKPLNQKGINLETATALQLNSSINIAVDFDETITKDPDAWNQIMKLMHNLGMKVYVVTYRNESEQFGLEYLFATDFIEKVVFTARNGKKAFCESLGIFIDIWVDDNPITITHTLLNVDANLHYTFKPDNMQCAIYAAPENIEQAEYERMVANKLPIPKH